MLVDELGYGIEIECIELRYSGSFDLITNEPIKILEGNYHHEKQQRTNQPNNKQQVEQYISLAGNKSFLHV